MATSRRLVNFKAWCSVSTAFARWIVCSTWKGVEKRLGSDTWLETTNCLGLRSRWRWPRCHLNGSRQPNRRAPSGTVSFSALAFCRKAREDIKTIKDKMVQLEKAQSKPHGSAWQNFSWACMHVGRGASFEYSQTTKLPTERPSCIYGPQLVMESSLLVSQVERISNEVSNLAAVRD